MTTSTIDRAARDARIFLAAIAALVAGCHREPAPPAPASASASASAASEPAAPRATKLAGAPAHVLQVRFAPDGASVLVLEERRKQGDDARGLGAFVISRRPTDGGAAVDLFAPAERVLRMAPLGDAVLALTRPFTLEETGELAPEGETRRESSDRLYADQVKMVLQRIAGGAAAARISPEGMYCTSLVGTADGQWVAFSLAKDRAKKDTGEKDTAKKDPARKHDDAGEETHVLGAQPGEDITLDYRSGVDEISPDGAHVLMRRPLGNPPTKAIQEWLRRLEHPDGTGQRVLVGVKDRSVTDLPEKIRVDGADVDTETLHALFAGGGLQFVPAQKLNWWTDSAELSRMELREIDDGFYGDWYRSALDGSGATRLAGSKHGADAGAPDAGGDAGTPEKHRLWISPKGALYALREDETGAVVLSRGPGLDALAPAARFEGPFEGIAHVALDAAEQRAALVVLSDTSRDGQLDSRHDDAEIFLAELGAPPAVPLGFGRGKVELLTDEIRPKVTAAVAGIPEASVTVVSEHGAVKATVAIPWIDGEDARALLARMFTAARAVDAALPQRKFALHVRAGEIDLTAYEGDRRQSPHHVLLGNRFVIASDATVLTLVHKNPRVAGGLMTTLTGELENTGKDPTPPIEVYAAGVQKDLGVIQPGKSAKYSITVNEGLGGVHAAFRAEGKSLAVHNAYASDRTLDALTLAIDAHARLGVWVEHRRESDYEMSFLVRLTADQAALDDRARDALFKPVMATLAQHRKKFHSRACCAEDIVFAAPGGGGWLSARGTKLARFEGDAEAQLK
jgi:hypothetical protein